jgi:hypothetical protein
MKTGSYVVSFFIAPLIGCATTAKYEKRLQSWMGSNETAIVSSWGPPNETYSLPDGGKILTWSTSSGVQSFSTYNQFTKTIQTNTNTYWCKTMMTMSSEGIVVNWQWQGNSCRSQE